MLRRLLSLMRRVASCHGFGLLMLRLVKDPATDPDEVNIKYKFCKKVLDLLENVHGSDSAVYVNTTIVCNPSIT